MKWKVEGANPKTGTELVREVEADSEKAAEKIASERGMLVSRVTPASDAPHNHATPRPEDHGYELLRGAGMFAIVAGVLSIISGCLCLVAGVVGAMKTTPETSPAFITDGIACVVSGVLFIIVGAIGDAVADIAANSWEKPK